MSHIIQPVMIRQLLVRGGVASVQEIAAALLDQEVTRLVFGFEMFCTLSE